tara:strand:+ start:65 stop:448 length:384 start_codon:yes stop_codon:yes gene_type:complete
MFKKILGGLGINVTKILDDVITNKEELLDAKARLVQVMADAEGSAQEQVTKRWEIDMKADNVLSKNIRPIVLIFLTAVFVIISFCDGNIGEFKLNEAYIPVYQTLLITVYGAYFAGRVINKMNFKKD